MKRLKISLDAALQVGTAGRCPPLLDCGTQHVARCATFQTAPKSDNAFALCDVPELAGITEFLQAQTDVNGSMHGFTPSSGRAARLAARTRVWPYWPLSRQVCRLDIVAALVSGLLHRRALLLSCRRERGDSHRLSCRLLLDLLADHRWQRTSNCQSSSK